MRLRFTARDHEPELVDGDELLLGDQAMSSRWRHSLSNRYFQRFIVALRSQHTTPATIVAMPGPGLVLALSMAFTVVFLGLALALLAWSRVRVGTDQAAIVHRVGHDPRVVFSDVTVIRMTGHAELVDMKAVTIELAHTGGEGLHCRDAIKAALTVRFTVRVNRTAEDVMKAAMLVGAERVSDPATLHHRFAGKFAEAVASVVCMLDYQDLLLDRQRLVDQIHAIIGSDLSGWVLDEVAIPRIEQVPIEKLDPNELLGARAILRITEETTRHRVEVARLEAQTRLEEEHIARLASS